MDKTDSLRANVDGAANDEQSPDVFGDDGNERNGNRLKRYLRRLTVNEWLTALIGVGSLAVSVLTYQNSRDTKEIKEAIGQLSDLARQTKRQAEIQGSQLALLKEQREAVFRQADAAADSAAAAKETARTAKGQTAAIIKQADALISGAQATVAAAGVQLASAQANIRTAEAGAKAAEEQLRSATLLASTRAPDAKLSSVQLDGWNDMPDKDGIIKLRIKPVFKNIGGGTLLAGITTFNFLIDDGIPSVRPTNDQKRFGGNEHSAGPNDTYGPTKDSIYPIAKTDLDDVKAGKKQIIVWGTAYFSDNTGNTYKTCYIYLVYPPSEDSSGGTIKPLSLDGYRCSDR